MERSSLCAQPAQPTARKSPRPPATSGAHKEGTSAPRASSSKWSNSAVLLLAFRPNFAEVVWDCPGCSSTHSTMNK